MDWNNFFRKNGSIQSIRSFFWSIKGFDKIKLFVLSLLLLIFSQSTLFAQCTVVGNVNSGQSGVQLCSPVTKRVTYHFEFITPADPTSLYLQVYWFWNDGQAPAQTSKVATPVYDSGLGMWYIDVYADRTFPTTSNCEYSVDIQLAANGFMCPNTQQNQVIASWHLDNDVAAGGTIAVAPLVKQVCEGVPLVNFQFSDASTFSCTLGTNPLLKNPNFKERSVQFIYGTNPIGGQGIPNLSINVYGSTVILTDGLGNPVPNSWTINPLNGATVPAYSTNSGFFEGPVIQTGLNPINGSQLTFPINFNGVGTFLNDQFEVTVRNWNYCNPWNSFQSYPAVANHPNAVDALTSTASVQIVAAPPAPTVPNSTICRGDVRTLTVTSVPVGTINWYSDITLTTLVATGLTYTQPQIAPGVYNYWVVDKSLVGLLCQSPSTLTTLTIHDVIANNTIAAVQTICSGTAPAALTGALPTGGNGIFGYLWQSSTTGAGGPWAGASGTNNTQNYTPGVLAQTTWYRRRVASGPCSDFSNVIQITVNPTPAITPMAGATCSATAFTVTPVNGVDGVVPGGTTYSWPAPVVTGGITGGAAGAAAANINGTLSNPTNTAQTATYTVTPLAGVCTGATFTVTVTVNPKPNIANKVATACGGSAFTVTPVNGADIVPVGTTYSWPVPVVTGGLTGGAAGAASANITGTLNNPTNVAQTATYTVTPLSGGCTGSTFTVTVTVNPKPAIANKVATACSAAAFTVTPVNGADIVPAGTTYSWPVPVVSGGLTGGAAGAAAANISGTLSNPTNTPQTATYTVTPLSGACTGSTFTVTVTVNPVPNIANKVATTCGGTAFTVTPVNGADIVPAGTTYSWPVPVVTGGLTGGAAGAAAANISGTLNNPTNVAQTATYTVTPLSGACTGTSFTVTVTVNPTPAIANKVATACSAAAFTVTPVNGADIVPAGTTYSWPVPVVTGGITGGAAGAAAANISGTLNNPTNTPQTATYTVTSLSGACTGATFTVTITVNPKPNIANKVATTCGGTAFTVTPVNGADIVPAGTTYSWPVPVVTGGMTGGAAGAAAANISGTLNNPTNVAQTATYTVTPLSGACTGSTFTVTVTVNPTPSIANKVATTCGGTAFTVTPVNGADIVPAGTTYSWPVPVVTGGLIGGAAGAASANVTGTLNNPTNTPQTATYTVTPLSGACTGATFTVTVTVNPKPNIANKVAIACSAAAFTVTPVNGADIVPAGTTYSWPVPVVTGGMTGGAAGAAAANITGTLNNPTNTAQTATYTVTPLSGACTGSTFTVTVTVNPVPNIANKVATTCGGAAFTVTPVNGADIVPAGTTYSWPVPIVTGGMTGGAAGAASANITGTLNNPTNIAQTATYTVTPLSGACTGAIFTVTVTVNPTPAIANKVATACSAAAFTVTPVNGADIVPAGTTYSWPVPVVTGGMTGGAAGAAAANITGTLNNPTNTPQTATYTVTPLSGACTGATFTVTVTVNPKPNIANKVTTTCGGTAFTVTPVNGADIVPAGTTYSWPVPVVTGGMTGGAAGAAAANISGTLNNPTNTAQTATYTITPLSGACTGSTFTVTVTVNPTPSIANTVATTCSATAFTVTPVNGADIVPAGTTYSWPVPVVTGGMTGGAAGAAAANISGTLNNPTAVAQTATYTVTPLSGACTGATFTVTVTVNPLPTPVVAGSNSVCANDIGIIYSTPFNAGRTYLWAISGGAITAGQGTNSITVTWGVAGAGWVNVRETINVTTCNVTTANYNVTINPSAPLAAGPITGVSPVCQSQVGVVYSVAAVANATNYVWTVPAGGTITAGAGTRTITVSFTAGASNLTIQVYPENGCGQGLPAQTFPVIVNPTPAITPMVTTTCGGTAFAVTPVNGVNGFVPGATTYSWPVPVVTGGMTGGAAGAAAASISGTLNNPTNIAQTATYTITPLAGACAGATFTVTVTVNPTPAVANKLATTCSGAAFTVTPINGADIVPAGTTYSWPLPVVTGGMTGGATGAAAANISGTLNNPTNVAQTATYTVTPLSGACIGATFTVTVTVNPVPNIANKVATACSAAAFTVTPVNGADIVPAATTYSWPVPVVTGGMTGGAAGAGAANINGTLNNPTNTPQTATYTVTPLSGACTGATFTVTVTVNPKPNIANTVATTCSAAAFTVTPVNGGDIVPVGTTYSWPVPVVTGGMTGGAAGAAAANITGTLNNPTNTAQTATYTVTPLSGACTGTAFTVTVTVNPTPSIANKVATACSAAAFTVTPVNGADIVPAGTTYSWPVPVVTGGLTGGAAGAAAANISGTLSNPTNTPQTATYMVTPLSGTCTGATFTVTITVNPVPNIANKVATTCGGTAFTVTPVNGADIVPAGTTYSWPVPVVTGGLTGGAAGAAAANISGTLNNPTNVAQTATYTVTPLSGACTGTAFTVTVTVNPTPSIANKVATACSAAAFTVTPVNGADIVPAGTTYSWPAPAVTGAMTGGAAGAAAANISGTLNNPTNTPQTATYTVTPLSGACTGVTFTVTVTVNPKPNIANKVATTCGGTAFTVTPVNGADIVPAGTTYSWPVPVVTGGLTGGAAGAAAANISGTLNNPTNTAQTATYTVTPLSGACTGSTFTVAVTVNPTPSIANKVATSCSAAAFTVTPVNGADIVPAGTTYSWPVPAVTGGMTGGAGGAASANITGTLTNPTNTPQTATYIVTPLSGACTGATFTVTVTVNPVPVINNMVGISCGGSAFTVTPANGVNGIVPAGTTYSWPVPAVTGGLTGGAAGAAAANISGTLNNPTNTAQTATYTVTPLSGACTGATFTVTITVNPTPNIANKLATTCGGTAFTVTPVNGADIVPAGTTYSWPVPVVTGGLTGGAAGAAAANISGTLNNPTNVAQTATYTVTPLSGACTGTTFTVTVTVNPTPAIANKVATTCSGAAFTVTPVNGADIVPAGTTYSWPVPVVTGGMTGGAAGAAVVNITGTLNNPTNTPQTATYTVTPLSGACTGATFTVTVTINPVPNIANKVSTTCGGTAFTVTPVNGADIVPAGTTYSWPVPVVTGGMTGGAAVAASANITGTLNNPTNTPQTATYTVTPLSGACTGATFTVTVTVNPKPNIADKVATTCSAAAFTVTPVNGADIVPAGTTYSWPVPVVTGGMTGGAAGAAAANISGTLSNPTNTAQTATYTVTPLSGACTGSTFTVTVTVNPVPNIANKVATTCGGTAFTVTPVNGADIVPAGTTYSWPAPVVTGGMTGGAAGAAAANISGTLNNPTNTAQTATYTVTPLSGACTGATFTVTVTVNPTPSIANKAATTCGGTAFTVTPVNGADIVPAGTTYSWPVPVVTGGMTGGAAGAVSANITGTLNNPTNVAQTATYTVTPLSGACTGTAFTVTVTVNPTPAIANKVVTTCSAAAFTVTPVNGADIVPAGTTYSWAVPVVTGGMTGGAAGAASANITGTLTNPTNTPQTATYTVTPLSGACTGATFTVTVTVNPVPAINNMVGTSCGGSAFTITPANGVDGIVPAGTTYSWPVPVVTGGLTGGAVGAAAANISGTLNNPTNVAQTATYTVTPLSGACTGATFTVTITVNPKPNIANKVATTCSTVAFTVTPVNGADIVPAGTTYSWPVPVVTGGMTGGAAGAAAANISGTLTNPTANAQTATYTVTPLSGACTGSTFTVTMTVNPTPVLSTTLTPADVCSNTLFSYPPASATAGTTFNWTRATVAGITPAGPTAGANNPNETLRNITNAPIAVTYQFTLAANGCSNVQNVVVNINPEPVITPGQNPGACSGNALSYQILLDNFTNPADNVTFTWGAPVLNPVSPSFTGGTARAVPSAANITDTFINTLGIPGTATYTVTPFKNGCSGTPVTVVVIVGSEPVLDPGLNAFACSDAPIGLILKEAVGSVVPTYYNVISKTVAPGLTDVGNAAIPNGTAPANYLAGDKFTNTTGVDKTVTYRIQPILAPTCIGAAVDVVITIRPQPVIFPAQSKTVCSRVAIGKEILLAPPNVPAGSVFNWPVPVISDGSIQGTAGVNVVADPAGTVHINDQIHNYSAAPITATYTVTAVSQFGCAGTSVPVIITINPEPIPQPISGRDKLCVNDKNVVYNVSAVGGSTFHWTVDPAIGTKTFDFNTNAILLDAAAVAGSGNITVYEINSFTCSGDISTLPVQVYALPAPENIIGNAVVCANSTQVYNVTNRVGSVYSWTVPGGAGIIGDPSASSITVIFANVGGTISVRETNAAGCITNHTPKAITVNPLPTATISGGATICDGASRNLSVAFTGTGPYIFTYALNGIPQAPVATAANPYALNVTQAGTYTIVNVSDANCTNGGTGTTTVTFFPKPTGTISGTFEMCLGGSATLTMTFTGVAPYTFTYTDGTTPVTVVGHLTNVYTASVSPVVNTTYTLTSLTDGNSCTGVLSGSAVISVNVPPALTLTGTNLICYNVNTGAVNMAIANGTAPFGFSWTGPSGFTAFSQNISLLAAGYYAVVVTDTKGCTGNANITLTQPPVLNGSAAGTNITCFGANDGTITVSGATGGAGTYEFSRDGGTTWQASPVFSSLIPGSYNVLMRDAVNPTCMLTLNGALLLTQPAVLNGVVTKTDVNCFGANNGSIVISAPTGGYGTYGYSIDGGATWQGSGNFTNLAPATYDVRIRDAVNTACVINLSPALALIQPVVLSATVNSTNVTCFGLTNGSITVSAPAGGHGTFEYSINGGGSWQASGNFTALAPGTYNVQIRDAAYTGCYIILNAALVISQPAVLQANMTSANVTCNGVSDGIINITAPTGGFGTYEYSITGGAGWQGAGLFNALGPGTYDVRIRDAANPACFIILNAGLQITEPLALNALVIQNNITCFGANDGQIQVTNSAGGYGTYEYTDNGGGTWQASPVFSSLIPGSYNVQIRDKAHAACVKILDAAVVITQPAVLNAVVNNTNVTCFGANDGTITISAATGGYGSYGYSINGGTSWQGTGNFTNLIPGTYNIRIRDAVNTGCIIALNPAVVITEPVALSAAIVKTNVNCNGAGDGTITINGAAGGYGTYEYTVNGGASWQASPVFSSLIPGFYNVKIRDAANIGCIVTLNGSLNVTEPAALNATITSTNVTCNSVADGTITISGPSGGYGTYEYSINGGTSWQGSGAFINLAPSTYDVRIRDAAHTACIVTLNSALVITQLAVLNATVTPTMVTCNGANDGVISITGATGGSGTYEYTVTGGAIWTGLNNFTNRAPGIYDVRIRDAVNTACFITLNPALTITQPTILSATVTKTDITCFGSGNGTITISTPAGGYGTYEYSINGGGSWQASGNFTPLGPGNYNAQIRDAAHTSCVIVLNNAVQITQPPLLAATVTKTDISCNGAIDGIINITAPTGGYGTYEYSITGGAGWQGAGLFNALAPGTYDVRIRDAANTACSVILYPNMVITEPIQLAVTSTGDIFLNCNGDTNGTGTFYGSGGTMPYTFHVVTNTTGATLAAPGFNSQTFFNAGAGTITVAITDFKNCFAQTTINVTQPALLTPGTIGANQILCAGDNPAQLTETVPASGGPGAYNYQWQYGSTAAGPFINIAGATTTLYTPVAGANNTLYYRRMITSGICLPVYSNVIEVLVNPRPVAILTGGETICPSQSSILKVNMMVGTGPFEIDIDNLGTITGYVSGADITVSPVVTTTYKLLRVRDANGCEVLNPSANLLGSATVTVRALPAITTSPVNRTICEYGLVSFNVVATGSDLTYQWYVNTGSGFNPVTDGGVYFGATNSTLSLFGATRNMNAYVYHVVVTGCSVSVNSADATLTVNTAPEITTQPKDSTICVNAGAEFSVVATGTGINYQWQVNKGAGFINVVDDANFSGSNLSTLTITNSQAAFNNYIFRAILTGTCGIPTYSNFAVLRVNIPPVVTLNPVNKAACDGTGPVVFSGNGSGIIDSLRWQVFSGGVWSDVHDNAVYSGSTSQQLTLMTAPLAFNGNQYRLAMKAKCTIVNTTAATLTVNPNPVVNFTAIDPIHSCGNVPLVINGNPAGGSGVWSTHQWTGDVGPLNNYFIQSPTFNSLIAGSYVLNYKVKDNKGCFGNGDVTVIVDAPDATFNQDRSNGCTPATVSFTKDMTGIAKFWWDFGDGTPIDSVNANPVHTFTNSAASSIDYYNVKLTVRSPGGCLDTFTSSVTVYPVVDATFTATPSVVCSGNAIILTAQQGASRYFWNFGDGVSGYFPNTTNHMYTNFTTAPVNDTITLTTTSFYSCTDVQKLVVTVMPVPVPQFTATPVLQEYDAAGNPVVFTNATNPGTWTWLWKFGDGITSTDQNPSHTYTTLGNFDVILTVSNANCADSVKHQVRVTPKKPVANFDLIPSGCSPLTINTNNTSLYTDTPGTSYMWDFGDGGVSTSKNASYTYFNPGVFKIQLTVTGPGGISTYAQAQLVNAYPSPFANFEVSPTVVFANDEKVRMFNLTQGADSYLWEFGDGDTSKVKEPYHKYMDEGVYDVTLWAYLHSVIGVDTVVCSSKYLLSPAVTVEPAGVLRFSTVFTPNKEGEIDMDHLPTGGTEIDQFFFPPIREKVISYKLQIFNRLGVLIFESHDINKPWNGYYHSKLCPQGVYVWYVEGKYANGQPFKKVGDVTLLH